MIQAKAMQILVAEKSSFSERGLQAYAEIVPTEALDLTQEALLLAVPDYEILVVRLGLKVDEAVLAAAKHLQAVATPTTGLDHIDQQAAERRGIAVLSLKGERAFLDQVYATAEYTFAIMLSLVRRIPSAFCGVKDYQWRRDLYRGRELSGKTLGVVGCGRLGSMVARYGAAFGMTVVAYDPYLASFPAGVAACASLADLLAQCDVISIHVPLNDETTDMFSDDQFARVKPGAWLVNTARGAVIDEGALLRAIESGRLAGAALDVLRNEHQLDAARPHPLIEYARLHENLLLTPHIGGATQESIEKADLFIAEKIKQFLLSRV